MKRNAEAKKAADKALVAAVQRVEEEATNRRLDRSIRTFADATSLGGGDNSEARELRQDKEKRRDMQDALELLALAKRLILLANRLDRGVWGGKLCDMADALDAHVKDAKAHLRQFYDR
jgi:hypothetical protein